MATYVIDANRGLWRVDHDARDDFESIGVERFEGPGDHRVTARLRWSDIIVDPSDHELAGLAPEELARFGMTKEQLQG